MLLLEGIKKIYQTGGTTVAALGGVSLAFDRGEFVAVLGPSGCGKTTLLNIIGGLDHPDEGELRIQGRNTRHYTAKEMDAYRNHSVGFVFQSYNLIAHQSVLANVELALTLSGISQQERVMRAKAALEQVGLSDQAHKRPNQLSGGQMQRVAIARAIVNDPDVLLADEPTGALDSHTSTQVLDILKQIAAQRLVIMVTHNRELAEQYATRIIELKDGLVVSDTKPMEKREETAAGERPKKTSMSFLTALSLSFNNLLTKRGRTLITAFAGSIGIIGIALILALSNGVNQYIINVQKETMLSYPITIDEQTFQVDGMMNTIREQHQQEAERELDRVYINAASYKAMTEFQNSVTRNNLTAFKAYLDKPGNPFEAVLTDIRYGYDANFSLYTQNASGELIDVSSGQASGRFGRAFANMLPFSSSVLKELLPSSPDGLVGEETKKNYTLLAGTWPQSAGDLVLILDKDNQIADFVLYQLGLLTPDALQNLIGGEGAEQAAELSWQYGDLLGKEYKLLAESGTYVSDGQGQFKDARQDSLALQTLVQDAMTLSIVGILRMEDERAFTQGGLGYTRALTDEVVAQAAQSAAVLAQQAQPERSVLNGLRFAPVSEAEKAEDLLAYIAGFTPEMKTEFAMQAMQYIPELMEGQPETERDGEGASRLPGGMNLKQAMEMFSMFSGMQSSKPGSGQGLLPGLNDGFAANMDEGQLAGLLDAYLAAATPASLALLYDRMVAPDLPNLDATLRRLGMVNPDLPTSISLYTDTFENKETITRLIEEYNQESGMQDQIVYTDYVALMISGVTTIINVISYVLIAFVAVSLVVSSIMIGIITYISVLERTKEIGILRAIGASRKDVARVFTAEAFIIGLAAGILGILVSLLLLLPINAIIARLADDATVRAILPLGGAFILIAISAALSLLAGFIPSRIAAKKDPVEALRTE